MAILSAFADEISENISTQAEYLNKEKIGFVELRNVDGSNIVDLKKDEIKKVKDVIQEHGLKVNAIGSPIGKVKINEPFEPHLDKFKHTIDLALFFEAPFIRIFSYYPPDGSDILDHRSEVMDRMFRKVELLENIDVVLVSENEDDIYGETAKRCVDIAKTVNSPKLRLLYDPGNFSWREEDPNIMQTCWGIMKDYVSHIHIKDWIKGADAGSIPGEGGAKIKELFVELAKMKYKGFMTLEPHLRSGDKSGGVSGAELFSKAVAATRKLAEDVGLECD